MANYITPLVEASFIIAEAALTTTVGTREVMRAQRQHLPQQSTLRNVEIQFMPSKLAFHPGHNGSMVVLETLEHRQVGYIESQDVGLVITDPAEVGTFGLRHGKLRTQALNAEESARLIERVAGEV